MLGKCQWKMFSRARNETDPRVVAERPQMQTVLNCFLDAIKTVPKPKDNRQDPILEPHYKLVAIVHKLVTYWDLKPQEGANLLQQQPFAVRKGEYVASTTPRTGRHLFLRVCATCEMPTNNTGTIV